MRAPVHSSASPILDTDDRFDSSPSTPIVRSNTPPPQDFFQTASPRRSIGSTDRRRSSVSQMTPLNHGSPLSHPHLDSSKPNSPRSATKHVLPGGESYAQYTKKYLDGIPDNEPGRRQSEPEAVFTRSRRPLPTPPTRRASVTFNLHQPKTTSIPNVSPRSGERDTRENQTAFQSNNQDSRKSYRRKPSMKIELPPPIPLDIYNSTRTPTYSQTPKGARMIRPRKSPYPTPLNERPTASPDPFRFPNVTSLSESASSLSLSNETEYPEDESLSTKQSRRIVEEESTVFYVNMQDNAKSRKNAGLGYSLNMRNGTPWDENGPTGDGDGYGFGRYAGWDRDDQSPSASIVSKLADLAVSRS